MTELIEASKNNPKTQKDREIIVDKYSNESYRTQSKIGKMLQNREQLFKEQ